MMQQPPVSHIDTISFFSAYVLHIIVQHAFHALLVYGLESVNTAQKYWQTLRGTYQAYITSAVGSTLLNTFLLKLGVNRTVAFMATLWIFACINYLWIGYVVRRAVEKGESVNPSNTSTATSSRRGSQKVKETGEQARRRFLQMRGGHVWDPVAGWFSEAMPVSSFASP
jgi:FlaA1/EpsC-like NDP-sugar epimerase